MIKNIILFINIVMISVICHGISAQPVLSDHQLNAAYYLVSNHSTSGTLAEGQFSQLDYGDYGNQMSSAPPVGTSVNQPFGWQQQYQDQAIGLTYLRARYYQSALKIFMTMDSYSLDNKYIYGWANPINFADASGHIASAVNYALNGIGLTLGIIFAVIAPPTSAAMWASLGTGMAAGTAGLASQILVDTGATNAGNVLNWVSLGLGIVSPIADIVTYTHVAPDAKLGLVEDEAKSLDGNVNEVNTNESSGALALNIDSAVDCIKDKFYRFSEERQQAFLNNMQGIPVSKEAKPLLEALQKHASNNVVRDLYRQYPELYDIMPFNDKNSISLASTRDG